MPPLVLVRLARLYLFGRICRRKPVALIPFLDHTLQYKSSWLQLVHEDLQWISLHLPPSSLLSVDGIFQWAQMASRSPSEFRSIVARTCLSAIGSSSSDWGITPGVSTSLDPVSCPDCARSFPSKAAMISHCCRVHGTRSEKRRYAPGTSCTVCLLEFHTRDRLVHHFRRNGTCWLRTQCTVPGLTVHGSQALDDSARPAVRVLRSKGQIATYAEVPSFRLPGPIQFWADA